MNAKRRGGANKRQPLNFLNPEHVERERGQQKVHVWELRNGRSRNPRTPKEQRERMGGQSILQLGPWRGGQVEKHNLAHGPEPWPVTCSNDSKIILTGSASQAFPGGSDRTESVCWALRQIGLTGSQSKALCKNADLVYCQMTNKSALNRKNR